MATWQIQEWSPGRCGGPEHRRRVTSRRGATPYLPSTPRPALIAGRASHRIGRGLHPRPTPGYTAQYNSVAERSVIGMLRTLTAQYRPHHNPNPNALEIVR